jgi:hypothetical protein
LPAYTADRSSSVLLLKNLFEKILHGDPRTPIGLPSCLYSMTPDLSIIASRIAIQNVAPISPTRTHQSSDLTPAQTTHQSADDGGQHGPNEKPLG